MLCWTGGTHDFSRLKTRWGRSVSAGDVAAVERLFAVLLIALRGSCCIYQGDELGLPQAEVPYELMQDPFGLAGYPAVPGRDGSRTPMPWVRDRLHAGFSEATRTWLPVAAEHRDLAVDVQVSEAHSLLNFYRRALHWRQLRSALQGGRLTMLDVGAPLLAFVRERAGDRLLCVFNFSTEPATMEANQWASVLPVSEVCYRVEVGDRVEFGPFGVCVADV